MAAETTKLTNNDSNMKIKMICIKLHKNYKLKT